MVKITWRDRNYFPSSDVPGWLEVDTEGATIRLRIYDDVGDYIDDTLTNTNRTGRFYLQIWSTNPHSASQLTPIKLTVDIFDTTNHLIEERALFYLIGPPARQITARFPDGTIATPQYVYVSEYQNPRFNILSSGAVGVIDIPVNNGWIEMVSYRSGQKYYLIGNVQNIPDNPVMFQGDKFDVTITFKVDANVLKTVFHIPGAQYFDSVIDTFYNAFVATPANYADWIAVTLMQKLGINLPIKKTETYSSGGTVYVKVTVEQDIAWTLIVFLIIAGIIALYYIRDIIQSIETSQATIQQYKSMADIEQSKYQTVQKLLDIINQLPEGEKEKALNELMTSGALNPTSLQPLFDDYYKKTQDLINQLNQKLNMMIVVVGASIVVSILAFSKG